MARVLLVFGEHLSGKSKLAKELKAADPRLEVIDVDAEYVKWVKDRCPQIYFEYLSQYIYHHYNCILLGEYSRHVFGRDLVADWHAHLLTLIVEGSQRHEHVAVDGYLLFDCKDAYQKALTKRSVKVFQIRVEHGVYFSARGRLTIEQIAALGT